MAELKNVVVDAISLVKAGANGEPIQIYKSAEPPAEDPKAAEPATPSEAEVSKSAEPPSVPAEAHEAISPEAIEKQVDSKVHNTLRDLFAPIIKAFTGQTGEAISKASDIDNSYDPQSFVSRMTQPEERLDYALYQLMYTFWSIFWDSNCDNGKELIEKNIDDFKEYVMKVLDGPRDVAETFFEKGDEDIVKKEDLAAVMAEALAPVTKGIEDLTAKLTAVEKSTEPETPAEGTTPTETQVEKAEEKTEDQLSIFKSAIAEAIAPMTKSLEDLASRVETVEKTKGISKSAGEPKSPVEKGTQDEWPDIHIPGIG